MSSSAASSGSSSASSSASSGSSSASSSAAASSSSSSSSSPGGSSSSSPGASSSSSPGASASSSSSSGGISPGAIAAIAIIGVILLILIVVLIIKFIKKNTMKDSTASDSIGAFFQGLSKETPKRFTSKELKKIKSSKELGEGVFGKVYEGKLKLPDNSQTLVAVKVLKESMNSCVEEQFIAKVGTMWRTSHINLVKLSGFCFSAKVKALVYEYMVNGSLDGFLSGKNGWLEMDKLHEIAVGTARGIRYLHEECHEMIIHLDIKPSNVLLDKDLCAKVGDFGLAELMDKKTTIPLITNGKGTARFSAPELSEFRFTHKSDVYSFGMLLFEMVGSRRNIDGMQGKREDWFPRLVWDKISKGEVESIMSVCRITEKNKVMAEMMCRVALTCIRHQPDTRPSMSSVLRMLEGEEEIGATVNPFNSSDP